MKSAKQWSFKSIRAELSLDDLKDINTLYVKVIYRRKTTQWKSIIPLPVNSVESAKNEFFPLMELEKRMIETLFIEYGQEEVSFRLINKLCDFYRNPIIDQMYRSHWLEFLEAICEVDSEFKNLVLPKKPILRADIYYLAAIKLIPDQEGLEVFAEKIQKLKKIENIFNKFQGYFPFTIAEWKFGNVSQDFIKNAKDNQIAPEELNNMLETINNGVIELGEINIRLNF